MKYERTIARQKSTSVPDPGEVKSTRQRKAIREEAKTKVITLCLKTRHSETKLPEHSVAKLPLADYFKSQNPDESDIEFHKLSLAPKLTPCSLFSSYLR